MLSKFFNFVKANLDEIILFLLMILISLLSFAVGYLVAKEKWKEPIRIEREIRNEKYGNLDTNYMPIICA